MNVGCITHKSHAVLTCHMSFSLRSSEETSGCRKYGNCTGGVFFFFFLSFFLGGVFVSLYCGHVFARTPCFSRALLRTATQDWTRHLDRREAKEDKRKRQREPGGQALVEVVVCAVGRVVILPLVEMTAQSTALPALVTCDGWIKQDQREWLSSLYCL